MFSPDITVFQKNIRWPFLVQQTNRASVGVNFFLLMLTILFCSNKLAWPSAAAGHMNENAQQNTLSVPFEAILYWATEPNKTQ